MMTAWQAASTLGNGHTPPEYGRRDALQLQRQRGDDAKRAFGTHQQPGQIVAVRRFCARGWRSSPARPSAITAVSEITFSRIVP